MQSRCIILSAMSVSRRFFARRKHEFSSWACLPLMAVGLNHPTAEKIKKAVKKFWTEHRDKASPLEEESSEPGSEGGHAEQEDLFSRLFTGSPTYKISGKQVRSGYTSFRSPSWAHHTHDSCHAWTSQDLTGSQPLPKTRDMDYVPCFFILIHTIIPIYDISIYLAS